MLTRRSVLISSTAVLALLATGLGSGAAHAAAGSPEAARSFVDATGKALVAVVNGGGSVAQRQPAMTSIIERDVDVAEVARFCLGVFWRRATPAQQQTYTELFHHVLVENITGKIGDFQGVGFTLGRAAPREGDIAVSSTVTRPGNAPNHVDWIVSFSSGAPKIVDVVAEGTSLRLTQRSDYLSYLARNGNNIDALIAAMRRQAKAMPG